jgi:hypothetical protein
MRGAAEQGSTAGAGEEARPGTGGIEEREAGGASRERELVTWDTENDDHSTRENRTLPRKLCSKITVHV